MSSMRCNQNGCYHYRWWCKAHLTNLRIWPNEQRIWANALRIWQIDKTRGIWPNAQRLVKCASIWPIAQIGQMRLTVAPSDKRYEVKAGMVSLQCNNCVSASEPETSFSQWSAIQIQLPLLFPFSLLKYITRFCKISTSGTAVEKTSLI